PTQAIAPRPTVTGAPMRSAKPPAISAPKGAMPMNIMEYAAMTRPRNSSVTIAWISVFEADISSIIQKPTGTNRAVESQKYRDNENRNRKAPNPPQDHVIHSPRPRKPDREANVSAPNKAPIPVAPIKTPRPCAPPYRMRSAKTGINTE